MIGFMNFFSRKIHIYKIELGIEMPIELFVPEQYSEFYEKLKYWLKKGFWDD